VEVKKQLADRIEQFRARNLDLDMTRGKPGPEQLDLCSGMLTVVDENSFRTPSGMDVRNYGGLDGFPEAKRLFADFLEVDPEEVIIAGNSSLNLMYDTVAQIMTHGTCAGSEPWFGRKVKFLCPVPGYDRHFAVCEHFGIRMVPVRLTDDGPDMEEVEQLVRRDPAVKGMWCVPKYSNPSGVVYSDETVERLARMEAVEDFRIFWDNAYTVHHLGGAPARLKNILEACKAAGNDDRVLIFGSTSKVSFPGAGIAVMGGSRRNTEWVRNRLRFQTIGPDKINMLRHVLYFKDMQGILDHMDRHAPIIAPKFQAVQVILERELGGTGVATWTKPQGGYFVSLETQPGCAAAAVAMAGELGVKFTKAGATWPYGKDPQDSNIRIAPTLPSLQQIRIAVEVLALCILSVSRGKAA